MDGGTKVSDKEFVVSTELLMRQLLTLDGIEAEGEAKLQRKAEVVFYAVRIANLNRLLIVFNFLPISLVLVTHGQNDFSQFYFANCKAAPGIMG